MVRKTKIKMRTHMIIECRCLKPAYVPGKGVTVPMEARYSVLMTPHCPDFLFLCNVPELNITLKTMMKDQGRERL